VRRATSRLEGAELNGKVLTLRFFEDTPERLSQLVLPGGELTIDLRQSSMGDYEAMRKCLALLVPTGNYGTIHREQVGSEMRLTVTDGAKVSRTYKLLVDGSTWGAAAVFARALIDSGHATVEGELPDELPWIEAFDLPDGSGFTLRTGTFVTEVAKK
jgi:hypothetical protein